jgi:CRP-like cAMP-binding protein
MDTTGFFDYPTDRQESTEHGLPGFLSGRGEDDWAMLLDHSETRLFSPNELVLARGDADRALYLLIAGWVKAPSGVVHPITTLGEAAFLDGTPRSVNVVAMSEGEMLRLSFESFEALSARNPSLGRDILLDLGRILSARLRIQGEQTPGWTG